MTQHAIFILGDSISMYYTLFLRQYLQGWAEIMRKGDLPVVPVVDEPDHCNGGDSRMALEYLTIQRAALKGKVLLFNCGLHDIKIDHQTGKRQVTLKCYIANLRQILALILPLVARFIWITTTPVEDNRHNKSQDKFLRFDADVNDYNAAASRIMTAAGIDQIDLNGFTRVLGGDLYSDHVHYRESVIQLQAAFIAGSLKAILGVGCRRSEDL